MSFARWARDRIDRVAGATPKTTIAVITGLVLLGLITHGHYAASGDAVHYLVIARSVAFDADFDCTHTGDSAANLYADHRRYHRRTDNDFHADRDHAANRQYSGGSWDNDWNRR